jgi:4-alpha-glucanotransferase
VFSQVLKSSGVAAVSGIKTRQSTGIGEFLDLKPMAEWCTKTGLQLIQILPINDSGEDPSPYSAASSFALHPIFVRPLAVCEYYEKLMGADMGGTRGWATSLIEKLNGNWKIDYPTVLQEKSKLMDGIFDVLGRDKVLSDEGLEKWIEANKKWLEPYAAFKVQMIKERSFNNKWFDCTTWSKRASEVQSIINSGSPDYDQVARVYFVQYHLHVQLLEASKYAESLGIAIKGDLPIGVTRCSQDVWAEPNLFKLDKNAGAPGDPEQNWGFPPYNWGEMHKDNCWWWRRRLQHMEQYFHAYRIDHVLGFFRMWEIPKHGSGGRYEPNSGLRENGLKNLRAIQMASNMLICGEDLGSVPPEVGPVLLELGVLGLKIQRWCDGKTWEYGYLTVAASSCHDTSPCRLWWNENWGEAERFYQTFVGKGNTPGGPPDSVSQKIMRMHAESSAMWTINPIQDYIDMFENLRSKNAKADMINVPGSTEGCWIYRCHQRMENLLNEDKFNGFLKKMLEDTKRGAVY